VGLLRPVRVLGRYRPHPPRRASLLRRRRLPLRRLLGEARLTGLLCLDVRSHVHAESWPDPHRREKGRFADLEATGKKFDHVFPASVEHIPWTALGLAEAPALGN
jgi:hypothetical protein